MPINNTFNDNRPLVLVNKSSGVRVLTAAQGALVQGTVLGLVTATGALRVCAIANGDGSEEAAYVLLHDTPNSAAPQNVEVLLAGEVNGDQLVFGGVETIFSIVAATGRTQQDNLKRNGIIALHGDDLFAWDNT